MSTFRDTEHLYRVLGALFERIQREQAIASKLAQANLVVRFVFKNPDGIITVNLREEPISFTFGLSDLEPDVEMTQSADTAHLFWLGRLSVPMAIATRKVIARGSLPKALALLPAVKPAFYLYSQVLHEIGEEGLILIEKQQVKQKRSWVANLSGQKRKLPPLDYKALRTHLIPLVEEEPADTITLKAQELPIDETALKREMLYRMILVRAFEERLAKESVAGTIPGEALHLSIGQEACAVGACFALEQGDYITTTHRGHGWTRRQVWSLAYHWHAYQRVRDCRLVCGRGNDWDAASCRD